MSGPGVVAVLEMLFLRSKSRLNSLRHCVACCVSSTWLPGRNLFVERVVDREDVGVQRLVAAVAELRPDAVARLGERAGAGAAGGRLRGVRLGGGAVLVVERLGGELARSGSPPLTLRSAGLVAQPSAPFRRRPAACRRRRSRCPSSGSAPSRRPGRSWWRARRRSTEALPSNAPPVPRRIARTLTLAVRRGRVVGDDTGEVAGLGAGGK